MATLDNEISSIGIGIDNLSEKLTKLNSNWGAVGSAASAALGSLNAALSKTNPILGSTISGLQKMIPIMAQIASAAKAGGAALKEAMASSGVGLVVIAVTELVNVLDKVKTKHQEQAQAAKDAADAEEESARRSKSAWQEFWDKQKDFLDNRSQNERDLATLNNEIAAIEARRDSFAKHGAELEQEYQDKLEIGYKRRLQLEQAIADERKKNSGDSGEESDYEKFLRLFSDDSLEDIDQITDPYFEIMSKVKGSAEAEKAAQDALKERSNTLKSVSDSIVEQATSEIKALDETTAAEERLKEAREERVQSYIDNAASIASSLQTVSNAVNSNLEIELQAGKISEKEYARKKKSADALNKASIVAQSAVAIAGAWKTAFSEDIGPTPAKLAMAGISTAAITASMVSGLQSIDSGSMSPSSSTINHASGTTQVYSVASGEDTAQIIKAINDGTSKAADSKVVLVVEDLNKVQSNMQKANIESSF